jgi:hypothetical protein
MLTSIPSNLNPPQLSSSPQMVGALRKEHRLPLTYIALDWHEIDKAFGHEGTVEAFWSQVGVVLECGGKGGVCWRHGIDKGTVEDVTSHTAHTHTHTPHTRAHTHSLTYTHTHTHTHTHIHRSETCCPSTALRLEPCPRWTETTPTKTGC